MAIVSHKRHYPVNAGTRLASMFLDHIIMSAVFMIPVVLFMIPAIFSAVSLDHNATTSFFNHYTVVGFIVGFAIYLNKDIIQGGSFAKRIMKLQVVERKTNEAASPLKCLLRNLTIILWPIEVIVVLISPSRRIGDRIAGTRIEYIPQVHKQKIVWRSMIAPILVSIGFSVLLSFLFENLNTYGREVPYVESSVNHSESQRVSGLFERELPQLIRKVDFRFYDSIANDDRRYISGILYFKNRSDLTDPEAEQKIRLLLDTQFTPDKTVSHLKFVITGSGQLTVYHKLYDQRQAAGAK